MHENNYKPTKCQRPYVCLLSYFVHKFSTCCLAYDQNMPTTSGKLVLHEQKPLQI